MPITHNVLPICKQGHPQTEDNQLILKTDWLARHVCKLCHAHPIRKRRAHRPSQSRTCPCGRLFDAKMNTSGHYRLYCTPWCPAFAQKMREEGRRGATAYIESKREKAE